MDTSETYIKMCEKAWQYLGIPDGPVAYKRIPLYCQDQLQEMISNDVDKLAELVYWYHEQGLSGDAEQDDLLDSMEKLWLAFVMKERWNKYWNGEDWGITK